MYRVFWLGQFGFKMQKQDNSVTGQSTSTQTHTVYSRVSFYDDSLLRPLSRRTEHFRLVVHHCRNPSIPSLLRALLALSGVRVFLLFLF